MFHAKLTLFKPVNVIKFFSYYLGLATVMIAPLDKMERAKTQLIMFQESSMKLEGQVAIVTGGGSGIGESTAKLFVNQGASVVIADTDYKNAKRVSDLIRKSGGKSLPLNVDVTIWTQVEAMLQSTLTEFGGLDILVNLAGRQVPHSFFRECY
ncbi:MAG: hypothetical protein CM1200mP8_1350 [Chloroflexota bacterium]|nr:MAG: hypothetical protein CM1200mP8_1350 [Chloroflexota bacterium]